LHGVAREQDILEALGTSESLQSKCQRLIELARAQGGPDNITVVLLKAS
jgi:serine/threonine protein phosphatase PrpC